MNRDLFLTGRDRVTETSYHLLIIINHYMYDSGYLSMNRSYRTRSIPFTSFPGDFFCKRTKDPFTRCLLSTSNMKYWEIFLKKTSPEVPVRSYYYRCTCASTSFDIETSISFWNLFCEEVFSPWSVSSRAYHHWTAHLIDLKNETPINSLVLDVCLSQ